MSELDKGLVERILTRLGLLKWPDVSRGGLTSLYRAWCRHVPFDNVRKLIHVRAGNPAALPGDAPNEFFEAWLTHGTGATCWAGNGALCELLCAIGFDARRAAATMMVAPNLPPNHGSVVVTLDDQPVVVDASTMFDEPLPIAEGAAIVHPAWGVTGRFDEGCFTIRSTHAGTSRRFPFLGTRASASSSTKSASRKKWRTACRMTLRRRYRPVLERRQPRIEQGGDDVQLNSGREAARAR
jgi:N-hydroxyarylamine O-acetyltransferase